MDVLSKNDAILTDDDVETNFLDLSAEDKYLENHLNSGGNSDPSKTSNSKYQYSKTLNDKIDNNKNIARKTPKNEFIGSTIEFSDDSNVKLIQINDPKSNLTPKYTPNKNPNDVYITEISLKLSNILIHRHRFHEDEHDYYHTQFLMDYIFFIKRGSPKDQMIIIAVIVLVFCLFVGIVILSTLIQHEKGKLSTFYLMTQIPKTDTTMSHMNVSKSIIV